MSLPEAEFPNYDGLSKDRSSLLIQRAPNAEDWNQLVAEVLAIQAAVSDTNAPTIPTEDPEQDGVIWRDGSLLRVSSSIPKTDPGVAGQIWNDGGVYKVSATGG